MRTRNLKPGFFKNDILGSMDPLCRILFSGLWCLADREGRLEDRPRRIKAELLPFDDCDCDALLSALTENEFIVRYEANGRRYIQIVNFTRHQHPHMKEAPSEIPPVGGEEKPSEEANFFAPDEHRANPSLNLKPQTLNLKPQTLNLNPQTSRLKSESEGERGNADQAELANEEKSIELMAEEVLSHFEKNASVSFRDRNRAVFDIKKKLAAGFSVSELEKVTEKMYSEWHGTKYEYLFTPSRIFGDKFEEYLLRKPQKSLFGAPKNKFFACSDERDYPEEFYEALCNRHMHENVTHRRM